MVYRLPSQWSEQQLAFIDWINSNPNSVILEAVAGSGKTTTILGAVKASNRGNIAIMAYNKKIAEEIKGKLADLGIDWKHAQSGTVHSFGFNALKKTFGFIKVDENKVYNIIKDQFGDDYAFGNIVKQLVSLAKQRAVGVEEKTNDVNAYKAIIDHFNIFDDEMDEAIQNEIISNAIIVLNKSINQTNVIDFDDMVYMPLMHPVKVWKFDTIIIDEGQDTNKSRRLLAFLMLKKGGRIAAVGDRHQAIYGFTGADSDSLDLIKEATNAIELPLTVTYRCPKKVVEFARQWVSHITAFEGNCEGEVSNEGDFNQVNFDPKSAILCRNTAPLVSAAFKLLRRHIPCAIEGRDIAKGIIKIINKWKSVKTIDAFENKLDTWFKSQEKKLTEKKLELLADQVETIKVIIEQAQKDNKTQRTDLVEIIERLFADNVENIIVLSTIHKSKGREWNTVYWLNRSLTCPSKYAKTDWQMGQEINLMYVAATRAMKRLVEISMV